MAQAVPDSKEFWRPPALQQPISVPSMAGACDGCGAEFMVGAAFCHACGVGRSASAAPTGSVVDQYVSLLRALEFQNLRDSLGLGTPSLLAFALGVICFTVALLVGFFYPMQNFSEFQAVQMWRMEWLLAAVAAFVAGILLKHAGSKTGEK